MLAHMDKFYDHVMKVYGLSDKVVWKGPAAAACLPSTGRRFTPTGWLVCMWMPPFVILKAGRAAKARPSCGRRIGSVAKKHTG